MLKAYIEGECFSSVRLWFSREENPVNPALSSNPQAIYEEWRRIVQTEDHGHPYVLKVRNSLEKVVRTSGHPPHIRRKLRLQIKQASIGNFYPQRLRLDLNWIAAQRGCTVQELLAQCRAVAAAEVRAPQILQPDEYLIADLPLAEFASWCNLL